MCILAKGITYDYERLVYPVIESMLVIEPNATYYSMAGENVVLFYPYDGTKEEYCYMIDGAKYMTIGTGSIDYFENYELLNKEVQQTLF